MWKSKARVTNYALRDQIHELRVQISRVTSSNPRVTSSNPRVAKSNSRVRTIKPRVARLKARVGRLKARVEAIKPRDNWKLVSFFYLRFSPKKQAYYFLQRNFYTNVCLKLICDANS